MQFHFTMLNHDEVGKRTLIDMYYWFRAGLTELGHDVTFSNHLHPSAINVIWENFSKESGEALAKSGLKYGIIATEIPIDGTFNNRIDGLWEKRWSGFLAASTNAMFIWSMVQAAIPIYDDLAPAHFIELGFTDALVPSWVDNKVTFKYDFCFLGNLTEYRRTIIERLEKKAKVYYSDRFLDWKGMLAIFKTSKIGLTLRQTRDWSIPSPTRIGRLLHSKRGIASEWTPYTTRQSQLITCSEKDEDFCEYALKLLATDWKQAAEERFEEYRKRLPMNEVMLKALNKICPVITLRPGPTSIGVLENKLIDFTFQPKLLKTIGEYNIVNYKKEYFAIPIFLGKVELESTDSLYVLDPQIIYGNKVKVLIGAYLKKFNKK
jgi:hypothetical protein